MIGVEHQVSCAPVRELLIPLHFKYQFSHATRSPVGLPNRLYSHTRIMALQCAMMKIWEISSILKIANI